MSTEFESFGLPLFLVHSPQNSYEVSSPLSASSISTVTYNDIWDRLSVSVSSVASIPEEDLKHPKLSSKPNHLLALTSSSSCWSGTQVKGDDSYSLSGDSVSDLSETCVWLDLDREVVFSSEESTEIPLEDYLFELNRPTSRYDRCFVASDGVRYTWTYHSLDSQEPGWKCTNERNYLVAHYVEPEPSDVPPMSPNTPIYHTDSYASPPTRAHTAHLRSACPPKQPSRPLSSVTKPSRFRSKVHLNKLTRLGFSSSVKRWCSRALGLASRQRRWAMRPGGMLVVNDSWGHLAVELFATLTIVQHLSSTHRK